MLKIYITAFKYKVASELLIVVLNQNINSNDG